jgi:sensor domain CHASE-containing protein/nitrogen-specific signal transduction histidine kinase
MSLRRKNFIAIISTLIGLVIVLFGISQFIILRQFDEQQQEAVHLNMDRALIALNRELDNLSSIDSDWAYWDDTYEFAQDRNQAYIDSNLTDDTLDNLDLDFMVFVDLQGKIIFSKLREIQAENAFDVQPDIMRNLLNLPEATYVNKGIILVSQMPALAASRAILQSPKTGVPQGMLILGRYLNQTEVDVISQQTQLSLSLCLFDAPCSATGFEQAKAVLVAPEAPSLVYTTKDQMAEGYSLLKDIIGKPVLILQIQSHNRIYQSGQQAVAYILVMLLVAGLVFGIVIIWLTERIVISRLAYMDRRVAEITKSNDLSARISISGSDEVTRLAATINDSLAKQERSQEEQFRELNTALTRVNGELQEKIADLKTTQKYKDRFFTHASHELRTPLAIIRNQLYLARKKPDQWQDHIDALETTLDRLLNVIDDIFDMTKLQDHNLTLNRQKVELKSFMSMILEGMAAHSQNTGVKLRQEFATDSLSVSVDFIYLGRACDKLIGFLLDSSQPDSEIVIALQKQIIAGKTSASIEMSSKTIHFVPEEIQQMFSPFYKVSEGNVHNTGLNLAIAQQIIHVHEGKLTAVNDPLKGGCFQITLPLTISEKTAFDKIPLSTL